MIKSYKVFSETETRIALRFEEGKVSFKTRDEQDEFIFIDSNISTAKKVLHAMLQLIHAAEQNYDKEKVATTAAGSEFARNGSNDFAGASLAKKPYTAEEGRRAKDEVDKKIAEDRENEKNCKCLVHTLRRIADGEKVPENWLVIDNNSWKTPFGIVEIPWKITKDK